MKFDFITTFLYNLCNFIIGNYITGSMELEER